ncbi:hypothetical protein [Rehaibacterium terrae]|jgi:hypothetical protein|uniref:Ferric-dicitrate binding protein FerR (Iron transport regulator) n=1 Tax=Rehaibacterium terrae TaxID=1341696 RepID=A0A7W7XZU7_9GAMM|nr:hypothetical protein [Rehaibacterium terrae]MBB5015509.1 ferric-dicitrate binding protein FerR (iron transport regulator) [Rehaibacterium terrae]
MNPMPGTDTPRPSETGDDARVLAYLAGLPEPEPPATLWLRLAAARQRRHTRRRAARFGLAAVAALALAVLAPWRVAPPPLAPSALPPEAVATFAMPSLDDADAIAELRALDRALQSAYEQGASEQEVAALWRARERAAARLQPATPPLPQPLRI